MTQPGSLALPVVDARELDQDRRRALWAGEPLRDREGCRHQLPRYFYRVDSWPIALETHLAEHFTVAELMVVDVREAPGMRAFPRYVPYAVTLLAAHLELFRLAAGAPVYVAANGGYRSPAHALTDHASPHCWGTAANIYRVGDEFLDTQERIERFAKLAARVMPAVWIRPYGHERGCADDHLHLDVGYVRASPRSEEDDRAHDAEPAQGAR